MLFRNGSPTFWLTATGLAALFAALLPLTNPACAQPSAATAYLTYRADLEAAESLDGFRAHLSSGQQVMLDYATERELASWLDKYKQKRLQSDIEVTEEQPLEEEDSVRLRLTGMRSTDGSPMLGRADMKLQDGSWRVLEELWYPDFRQATDPSVAEGDYATGVFRVNDAEIQMSHAYVKLIHYWADDDLPALELTISDRAIDPEDFSLMQRSKAGDLHYFQLTIGPEQYVTGGMMHHQAYDGGYVSLAGVHSLETTRFGPTVIEGRAFTEERVDFSAVTYYSVAFRATILNAE